MIPEVIIPILMSRIILMIVMVNDYASIVSPAVRMMIVAGVIRVRIPMIQDSPLVSMSHVSMSVAVIIGVLVVRVGIRVSYVLMPVDVSNVLMRDVCMSVGMSRDSSILMRYVRMSYVIMCVKLSSLASSDMP
jgi:intracellular septation protein A